MSYKPVVLVILDGVGLAPESHGNALALANKPNLSKISRSYPGAALQAAGIAVGLPWGEVGSSEVGHANIGSGRVLYQNYPRISLAIENGTFLKMPIWQEAVDHAKKNDSDIHLMGLLTGVGIHAHIDHLKALIETFKKFKKRIFLHLFTDGEDSPPRSALKFLEKVEGAQIASVLGRTYAMDRNGNWDLTAAAYNCLTQGTGETAASAKAALENAYKNGLEDESVKPTIILDKKQNPLPRIKEGDVVIFFNFRPDRARQLTELFIPWRNLFFVGMTQYREDYPIKTAFPPQRIQNPLSKILSDNKKIQLKIAESEKRAHITYFLNGGQEEPFENEERIIVPSLGSEYELNPEMSAPQITEMLINQLSQNRYDFAAVNFANGDMAGHTGNLAAATKAIQTLDECMGKIANKVLSLNGALIVTADHGNTEEMVNLETGEVDKEHSTNPVPFWLVTKQREKFINGDPVKEIALGGILADIAPTILELMGLPKPQEMEGSSLADLNSRLII